MKRALLLVLVVSVALALPLRGAEVNVSAAASLQDALREIATRYEKTSRDRIVFNFAASSTLAMQIRAGAPADLFFSADEARMDAIREYLVANTRTSLLSNVLVVVSERPIRNARELTKLRRIAIAEPSAVPAGVYAREWLQRIGLWRELQPRIIATDNVRSALAVVENGNVDAAFVYRTDARMAKRVRIAFEVRGAEAPNISYPVALLREAKQPAAARRFLDYLRSRDAAAVFERHGFIVTRR